MGNEASSGRAKGGSSLAGKGGAAGLGKKSVAAEESIVSNSRKEEVEAGVQNRKGLVFMQNHRYDDAMQAFDDSLKFRRMLNQESTFEFAATSLNYAVASSCIGGARMVGSRFDEAFALLRSVKGHETLVYASGLAMMGRWHLREGRPKEGIEKLREALALIARLPPLEKGLAAESLATRRDLAEALAGEGELEEAAHICERLMEETAGDNLQRGQVMVVLARVKLKAGLTDEARHLLRDAIALFNLHDPNEPLWLTRQKAAVPLEKAEGLLKQIS